MDGLDTHPNPPDTNTFDTSTFDTATALRPLDLAADGSPDDAASTARTWAWDVPDQWQQGRGAWGGLVTGALVRAIADTTAVSEPGRVVRTVSVHMSSPVEVGPHRIVVTPERVGSALSTWRAVIVAADGSERASGTAIVGAPRVPGLDTAGWAADAMPDLPPAGDTPHVDVRPPVGPVFAPNLSFRVATGMPFSSHDHSAASGWVGFAAPTPWTAASLLGIVDAWWPTAYVAITGPRPMATVSFEAHLLLDPASVPEAPLAFSSELLGVFDGFTTEIRRLWTADGRLAVVNLQSIAIIK